MNESGRVLTDRELEAALCDAGAHLDYPPAADLVPAVRARIRPPGPGFWGSLWSPRLALVPAAATLLLLALATVAFQPIAAQAAEAIGLRGLVIFRTAQTPPPATPRPSPSVGATSSPPGGVLSDARRVATVADASGEVGFTVLVPGALGPPDEVYVRVTAPDAQAFLVYRPRPGLPASAQTGIGALVTEVRGSFDFALVGKLLGPGSRAEQLTVDSARAVWIEGAPHQFFYLAPNGQFVQDTLRLSGNVLIWTRGDLLVRLEAELSRADALRIGVTLQ